MPPKSHAALFPRRTMRTTARKSNPTRDSKTLPNSPPPSSRRPDKRTSSIHSPPLESTVSRSSHKRTNLGSPQSDAGNRSNFTSKSTPDALISSPSYDCGGNAVLNPNFSSKVNPRVSADELNLETKCSTSSEDSAGVLNMNPNSGSKSDQKVKSDRGKVDSNKGIIKESSSSENGSDELDKNPKSTSAEGVSKSDQKVKSGKGKVAADVLNLNPKSSSNEGTFKESTSSEDGSDKNPKSTSCEGVSKSYQKVYSARGKIAADVLKLNPKSSSIKKGNQKKKSTIAKAAANVLNSVSNESVNVLNLKSDSTGSEDAAEVSTLNPKPVTDESANTSVEMKCSPKSSDFEENASIDPPSLKAAADKILIDSVTEARPVSVEAKTVGESGGETAAAAVTKKTVMKKTVRVVKRVVKKKVPKKKYQIASLNEELRNVETSKGSEMPDSSGSLKNMELKSCTTPVESELNELKNDDPVETVLPEVENLKADATPVEPELMEIEKDNPIDTTLPEVKNSKTDTESSTGSEETSDDADIQMSDKNEEDIPAFVSDTLSEDHAVIKNENSSEPTVSEVHLEDQNNEYETENAKSENRTDEEDEEEDVEAKEEVTEDSKVVINGSNNDAGPSEVILMSGELEALERRRKRKTEIFVGGLEKDAKEEDVRKAFEQIGNIAEVKIVFNPKTGKKKGFAFVRFASAADAKNALTKHPNVEICGKQCGVKANQGNDTLFIGNIDKKWNDNDLAKILKDIGIDKIDKVTVMPDPNKIGWNRGFAFLELETVREAQFAFNKLQNKDLLGKFCRINVSWADPLIEPDEEEILKLKSVYVEYLPLSWDEKKVIEYFSRFGEIGSVVLAKNLRNSKRKDFAFVKYTTREAALACIEAFSRDRLNGENAELKLRVSLAKPIPKANQARHVSNFARNEYPQERRKPPQSFTRPRGKGSVGGNKNYGIIRPVESNRSTNSELVHLLRQQASWRQPEPFPPQGGPVVDFDHGFSSPSGKRPFYGDDAQYSDIRGYPRPRFENSYSAPNQRYNVIPQNLGSMPLPPHHQQVAGFMPGQFYRAENDHPSYVQRREPAPPYHGSNVVHRRY